MPKSNSQQPPLWKHYFKAPQPKSLALAVSSLPLIRLMACAKSTPSAQLAGEFRKAKTGKRSLLHLLLSVPTNTNVRQVLGGATVSSELTQLGKEEEVYLQKCINSG